MAWKHEEFKNLVKKDPWLIFNDCVVKYAIIYLHVTLLLPFDSKTRKLHNKFLKDSNLEVFKPKSQSTRIKDSVQLILYELSPIGFLKKFKPILELTKKYYDPKYKDESIKKAYKHIFRTEMSDNQYNELTIEISHHVTPTIIALYFFWYKESKEPATFTFNALHKLFSKQISPELKDRFL